MHLLFHTGFRMSCASSCHVYQPARHGKAVYWDLGSAQSLGSVTADLKPGVARVEAVWAGQQIGTTVRTKLSVFQECFRLITHVQRQFWNVFDDRYQVISVHYTVDLLYGSVELFVARKLPAPGAPICCELGISWYWA